MELRNISVIAQLIVKHLRNELTDEEKRTLADWLERAPQNKEEFERICSEYFLENGRKKELEFDAAAAYRRFQADLEKRQKVRSLYRWVSVAAAVAILFCCGGLFLKYNVKEKTDSFEILPGTTFARLTLSDGKVISLEGKLRDSITYGEAKVNMSGSSIVYSGNATVQKEVFNVLEVPRKGEFKVTLSDGTRVWLNSESVLRYPVLFDENRRRVYLEGEAYFEVTPDRSRPFTVCFGKAEIEVLGTSFNVHCYKDEALAQATLVEGCVDVRLGNEGLVLKPGEQALIDRSGDKMEKREVNVNQYVSWKDGRFVFRKERLEEIMNTVTRWYGVEVVFKDESLKDMTFSGNLKRYENFDQIVRMLEMTEVVSFEVKGERIVIDRKK